MRLRVSILSQDSRQISLLSANTILGTAMPMVILGGMARQMLAPPTTFRTLPASFSTLAAFLSPPLLAMIECGFSEALGGDVIRWHVVAIFAPRFFMGFLTQRFGAHTIAMISLILLIQSSLAALTGLRTLNF